MRPETGLTPHGTSAAARRHYRHGEKPCEPCRAAANADKVERTGGDPYAQMEPEARGAVRNGIPAVPYEYRARTYTWAEANLRRAEQIYGKPPELDFEAG